MQTYQKVLIVTVSLFIASAIIWIIVSRNSLISEYENRVSILEKSITDERVRHEKVLQDVTKAYHEAALAREKELKKMNDELDETKKKHDEALKFIEDWKKGKTKKIVDEAGGDPGKLADVVSSTFGYEIVK